MKKKASAAPQREIVFQPALAPLEASVIPAKEKRPYGALKLARASFALDAPRAVSGRRSASGR